MKLSCQLCKYKPLQTIPPPGLQYWLFCLHLVNYIPTGKYALTFYYGIILDYSNYIYGWPSTQGSCITGLGKGPYFQGGCFQFAMETCIALIFTTKLLRETSTAISRRKMIYKWKNAIPKFCTWPGLRHVDQKVSGPLLQ